jgi:hypothetical protein
MSLTSEFKAAGDDQNLELRVTRSMTKGPACRAALQHPKILGQIVSHLPGYTILTRAQRVSKLWKDVINTSPIVQKKLWMRPLSAHIPSQRNRTHTYIGPCLILRSWPSLPVCRSTLAPSTLIRSSLGSTQGRPVVIPPCELSRVATREAHNDRARFESVCCSEPPCSNAMSSVAASWVNIALHERSDGLIMSATKQHYRAVGISASLRNGYLFFQAIPSIENVQKQSDGGIASESSTRTSRAYHLCQNLDDI